MTDSNEEKPAQLVSLSLVSETIHSMFLHDLIMKRLEEICAKLAEAQGSQTGTRWLPITTAPKTGEHILAARFDGGTGFGFCGGKQQADCDVVHYWDNPGEEGFYPSNGPDVIFQATHWQPLEGLPRPAKAPEMGVAFSDAMGTPEMPDVEFSRRMTTANRVILDASIAPAQPDTAEEAAKDFHETYERLAPQFGYETRKESAKPWAEIPENNRKLMIAVAGEVIQRAIVSATAQLRHELAQARKERDDENMSWSVRYDSEIQHLQDHSSAYVLRIEKAEAEIKRLRGDLYT